jgi:hypothetical protein
MAISKETLRVVVGVNAAVSRRQSERTPLSMATIDNFSFSSSRMQFQKAYQSLLMLRQRSLRNLDHGLNGVCGKAAVLGRHPLHYLRRSELSTALLSRKGASLRWTAPEELRFWWSLDRDVWGSGW